MKRLLIVILIASFLAGCGSISAKPTETPTSTATSTATATITPTPTNTSTPTSTPTNTPTPTRTPYPTPTPTPEGFYTSSMGFSLMMPANWEIEDESSGLVIFNSSTGTTRLAAGTFSSAEFGTTEDFITMLCQSIFDEYATYTINETEEVTFGDGSTATRNLFTCKSGSDTFEGELTVTERGGTVFLFFFTSLSGHIGNSQHDTINTLYSSIDLTPDTIYGLPRAETLLMLGYDPEPEDMDPALGQTSAGDYIGLLYSGLLRLTPDMQVVGDLAESWTTSPDGLVYTFTLRSGLTFQDGSPLTTEDVKYSWERAADPATDSPTSVTYLGDIAGFKDMHENKAEEISGVKVIDDLKLQVTLESPVQYFLGKLAYPTSYIVDKASIEADAKNWMFHPNASGPYGLKERVADERLVFERNDNFHEPALIRYVAYLTDNPGTSLSYYESGQADIVDPYAAEVQEIQDPSHPLHDQLMTGNEMCTTFVMLNNTIPPMEDANVRKALYLAIDKDQLVEQFSNNLYTRTDGILPPGMPGYTEFPSTTYDPQAAKDALAASSYAGKMPTLTLNVSGYAGDTSAWADAMIQMWRDVLGIEVQIEFLDPVMFSQAAREGHGHMVSYGWCADYPDPSNFLDVLFHSGSDLNVSGYTNTEADATLEKARTELDPSTRLTMYNQVETQLLDDYATIPIQNHSAFVLVNPRVKGFVVTPIGVKLIPYLWLEEP
jgi:oligopeptide transport system substrate-binding protein